MPYRARYRKVKKVKVTKTTKPEYTVAGSAWYLAQKALSAVNYIRGMINCEKKYFTVNSANTVDQNGIVVPLSQIDMGSGNNQRNGYSILLRSIYAQLEFKLDPSGTNATVRCIIIMDTENTGTVPTVSQLLQTVGSINAVTSPINTESGINRFKICLDKKVILCSGGTTRQSRKFFLKQFKHVKYGGSLGTDESKNQYYMMLVSSETINLPAVVWSIRSGYYDN